MAKLGASNKTDWASSIANQHLNSQQVKDVLVKTLPLDSIHADEDNPRSLAITAQEIQYVVNQHPFSIESLERSARDYLDAYIETIESKSGLTGKKLGDFINVIEFAASIKHVDALIQPIVVWREGTLFHLIVGERRWLAHQVLQAKTIAAKIYQLRPDQLTIDKMQWDENESRERMNLWDRVNRVEKIIEGHYSLREASKTTLSTLIGKSASEAARYLSVLRCKNPALKKAIQEGRINNLTVAEKLASKTPTELNQTLNGIKKTSTAPAIKLAKSSNLNELNTFLSAVANTFHFEEVDHFHTIKNHKDMAQAMEKLIQHVVKQQNQ